MKPTSVSGKCDTKIQRFPEHERFTAHKYLDLEKPVLADIRQTRLFIYRTLVHHDRRDVFRPTNLPAPVVVRVPEPNVVHALLRVVFLPQIDILYHGVQT